MRLCFRLWIDGELRHIEDFNGALEDLYTIAARHAASVMGKPHMIEIEFLDCADPMQRYLRFGTDSSKMVLPLKLK